ncbi:MAG: phosphatidylserine/phosphatidylglycerophosphate/cardiolipin synthase family protein [Verrucomicrobiota bacterium]
MDKADKSSFRWMRTGDQALAEMLDAIGTAKISVQLEMYIFSADPVGEKFRDALVKARQRGVRVQVLVDAGGSVTLADDFWNNFLASGGEFRWFNRLTLHHFGLRDHRKILVCDETTAFVGGFNIAKEYEGDGLTKGWRDLGLKICGPLAKHLGAAFDQMFALAERKHKLFARLRKSRQDKLVKISDAELLLSAPGRKINPLKRVLYHDLKRARKVQIICAYFLPTWRIRRELRRIVRHGGKVQLILPGKSDVALSMMAARSLYRRMLRAGIEVYEYQPQILHAKMFVIDDVVYAGSANLDTRSLHLNYELLVRLQQSELVDEAREIFAKDLPHCRKIELESWRKERNVWERMKGRWAYFILARLDPYISRRQWKLMR